MWFFAFPSRLRVTKPHAPHRRITRLWRTSTPARNLLTPLPSDVSRTSNIVVSAYLRTAQSVQGRDDMGNDLLMARVDLTPVLDAHHHSDQWYSSPLGAFHLALAFNPASSQALTIDAFELLKVIGKGSFGKVMQVRKKDTQRVYALKTIRKANIASRPGEITHILAERTVLALVNNPFIVPLKFSFQNPDKLYLVMSFVNGGELFYHLQREGKFEESRSRFYAAELLCALEHLHMFNVVYRDLKPENILLDYTGHIALCDFGLCKLNMSETDKTNSACGAVCDRGTEADARGSVLRHARVHRAGAARVAGLHQNRRLVDARRPPVRDDGAHLIRRPFPPCAHAHARRPASRRSTTKT
jgi:serine/threonine protein kinase